MPDDEDQDPYRPLPEKPTKPGQKDEDDGRTAIIPVPVDAPPPQYAKRGKPDVVREYRNQAGQLLFYQCRFLPMKNGEPDIGADGKRRKIDRYYVFTQKDGVREWSWHWRSLPLPRPMYRINFLAEHQADPVMIVEGEKAADAATRALPGWQSTCWMGGASAAVNADVRPLIGRQCYIWRDHDEAGARAAKMMAQLLRKAGAASVRMVNLETVARHAGHALKKGHDIADLIDDDKWDNAKFVGLLADTEFAQDVTSAADIPDDPGAAHRLLVERITEVLERDGITMNASEQWCDENWRPLQRKNTKTLARAIWFDFCTAWGQIADEGTICSTLTEIGVRRSEQRRETLVASIIGRPVNADARDQAIRFVRALCGHDDEIAYHVIRHFIWLCKRTMAGLPRAFDLMPVLVGMQEGGKSTAVAKLCAPLQELASTIQSTVLTDAREAMILGRSYIGIWDEMEGANRAEIEAIKNAITCTTKTTRLFHTQEHASVVRTMSFIGTSNKPIGHVIRDTTGLRRFAQIDVQPRLDWDEINAIDYGLLWQCVSEHDVAPIQSIKSDLRAEQEQHRHKDTVSLWCEQETWGRLVWEPVPGQVMTIHAHEMDRGESTEEVRSRYFYWCRVNGEAPIMGNGFWQRLTEEGFTTFRPGVGDGRQRRYRRPKKKASDD